MKKKKKMGRRNRAAVVVLGDFGRSPRMQYHALSLARQANLEVDVVAYGAVQWASWFRRAAFVVDWHNFGYTLLGLSLGRSSWFVRIYHWFEKHFGRMADGALCVTRAMQHELAEKWGITATVLYDHPPEFFHPASLEEKYKLFCRLKKNIIYPYGIRDCVSMGTMGTSTSDSNDTLFTTQVGTEISLKMNRPAIIVSSTSWTADEDFGMLLDAAVMYDRRVAAILNEDKSVEEEQLWKYIDNGRQYSYPRLLFIITGKGPEKGKYEKKIRRLRLKHVAFRTMWLPAEDYSLLLGSADLGVCLHTSSSGLDLPMKVVDMFGCGLPVCAVSYPCIEELVKVEKNGLLFSSSSELAVELL
ncbi:hypothetical protein AQUCO_71800001v1, partial [Aquilegia coerulea]